MINCITNVKTIVFFIRDGFTPIQKHAACQSDFICIGYLRNVINSMASFVDNQFV
jgi:hypothetical protein